MEKREQLITLLHGVHLHNILSSINIQAYPIYVPASASPADTYITYQRTGLSPTNIKGRNVALSESQYCVNVISNSYAESIKYTEQIINALSDYTDSDIKDIQILNLTETLENEVFIQIIEFKILM